MNSYCVCIVIPPKNELKFKSCPHAYIVISNNGIAISATELTGITIIDFNHTQKAILDINTILEHLNKQT